MPELNPTTRKRLWYIAAFLLLDGIVSMYICAGTPSTDPLAWPSLIFGLVSLVVAISIGAVLFATKVVPKDLFAERSRE
jgi:uncharacterized membrane protein HdeD (DUF308 family)